MFEHDWILLAEAVSLRVQNFSLDGYFNKSDLAFTSLMAIGIIYSFSRNHDEKYSILENKWSNFANFGVAN